MIEKAEQTISPDATKVWRISSILSHALWFLALGIVTYLNQHFNWYSWIPIVLYILIGIVSLHAVYGVFIFPIYMQRTWRYAINDQHIQLKFGAIEKVHTFIPMSKVQYVNTVEGPLLRRYGLATITIGTVASSHEIPALPVGEAEKLRNKIAVLAKLVDEEEQEEKEYRKNDI